MIISPKLAGVAAGGIVLALLAGYFFLWRPGQVPPILTPIQEKTISDLEAANEKLSEERKSLQRQAQANTARATRAEEEAKVIRGRFRDLEAQMGLIRAKEGSIITTPDEALKELKAMGWIK